MLQEFKEFISKGNVLELAVGIIIGAAFGKIVASLVDNVITPIVGMIAGKVNFASLFVALDFNTYASIDEAKKAGAPVLAYGAFFQNVFDFLVIAFVVFMIVKAANKAKLAGPAVPPKA